MKEWCLLPGHGHGTGSLERLRPVEVIVHPHDLAIDERIHDGCLSTGLIFFALDRNDVRVAEITNQSTGYCPEPESWPAVAQALDRAGIEHPGEFTTVCVFRRCEGCGSRNIVKDGWFHCDVCGRALPAKWNLG